MVHDQRTQHSLIALAGTVLLICLGLWLISEAVHPISRWSQTKDWIEVEARINKLELRERSSRYGTNYWIITNYSYDYQGRTFQGTKVGFELYSPSPSAYKAIKKRPISICYINPANPGDAVLYRGVSIPSIISNVIGALFFGGFGCFALREILK